MNYDVYMTQAGDGFPVLWSHGATSSQAMEDDTPLIAWAQVSRIARVIRYDARGHGRSGFSADAQDYTWDRLGQDMLAIASELRLERFILGGASMGCASALYATLAVPKQIAGLLLAMPPTAWETRPPTQRWWCQTAIQIERDGLPALLEAWRAEKYEEAYLRHLSTMDAQAFALICRGASLSDLPLKEQLRAIQVPTLILAVEGDSGHPLSTAHILHEHIPHSRLHTAQPGQTVEVWTELVQEFIKQF